MLTVANVKNHSYNRKQISSGVVIIGQRKQQNKNECSLEGNWLKSVADLNIHLKNPLNSLYRRPGFRV
jgi:hypothetical protein